MNITWRGSAQVAEITCSGVPDERTLFLQWVALIPLVEMMGIDSERPVVQEPRASAKQLLFARVLAKSVDAGALEDACDDLGLDWRVLFGDTPDELARQVCSAAQADHLIRAIRVAAAPVSAVPHRPRWASQEDHPLRSPVATDDTMPW